MNPESEKNKNTLSLLIWLKVPCYLVSASLHFLERKKIMLEHLYLGVEGKIIKSRL